MILITFNKRYPPVNSHLHNGNSPVPIGNTFLNLKWWILLCRRVSRLGNMPIGKNATPPPLRHFPTLGGLDPLFIIDSMRRPVNH